MSEADPLFGSALKEDWAYGPIFDADVHIDPPHDMWKDYLPESQKAKAPVIEHGDDCDYICFEGNRRPVMMINNQAGREGKNFKMVGRLSDQRNTYDPVKRLADMDLDGIDHAICFGGGPLGSFDNDLYIASFEAYSRWVMDWASNAPHRLFPVGHAPMRDIDETIEHVHRLAKLGFKMLQLPAFPQNPDAWKTSSGIKNLKDGQVSAQTGDPQGAKQYWQPEFDRLWKVLCDYGMVITFHLGGRVPRFGEKQYFLPDMPMSKLAMAEPIGIFIHNGIFDRFPDLRIGSMEFGSGLVRLVRRIQRSRLGKATLLDRESDQAHAELLHGSEHLGLVHPGPRRHHSARSAGRQEHHVVVGLSAFGNHVPEVARHHPP